MNETSKNTKHSLSYRIPRATFIWLLSAVIGVILPHLSHMPIWIVSLCSVAIISRVLIYQGKISYPGKVLKAAIVLLTLVAMIFQFGSTIISLDAMVNFLFVGISLKLLEMHRKIDVFMVIYLCYFTLVAEFIYSQSIPVAVYLVFCVMLITSALLSLHQLQLQQSALRTFKISVQILVQSVPIMLALFMLFPRISPMWSVSMNTDSAMIGLSESMSPGDIGELISSPDIAFRVKFDSTIPSNNQLYWRAITLENFDGRSWGRGPSLSPQLLNENPIVITPWYQKINYIAEPVNYNVIMEATNQNWVYTLKMPKIIDDRFRMSNDYQVESLRKISNRLSYDVSSYADTQPNKVLSEQIRKRNLVLPGYNNKLSRSFAQELRKQSTSDKAFVQRLLKYFREEKFFYTLSPNLLGESSIDQFLFETREGFCEHYSSAFTYLMRAAGVPARVVTGYQGGELNPFDNTLTVRQYDAHAWSEVWLDGEGWVRVDPTSAVAPERIELGSQLSLQTQSNFLSNAGFSMLRFRNTFFLNNLRFRLETLDYRWNRFVLNYDEQMQTEIFSQLFENVTNKKITLTVLGFIILCVGLIGLLVIQKSRRTTNNPATVLYLNYCKALGKRGAARFPSETPEQYYQRMSILYPQDQPQMLMITNAYVDIAFMSSPQDNDLSEKVSQLKRLIQVFSK